ncbi:MAG: hypothetical protein IKE92_05260 [Clostridiales bacterium]|nr:hypothetical protein [Clostridiales bacterium]
MANGKVITGYSMPIVAKYTFSNNTISYTDAMPLARGVEVSMEVETGDATNFYADNTIAEAVAGQFNGATATLTVDGLKDDARDLIAGITTKGSIVVGDKTVTTAVYDDLQVIPYVGIGFVVRYMENGVTTYAPVILPKAQFSPEGLDAATQGESVKFQTTELQATVMRADDANHSWKVVAADQSTEAAAVNTINAYFGAYPVITT